MLQPHIVARIQDLYAQGIPLRIISQRFGITPTGILHYIPDGARRHRSQALFAHLAPQAKALRRKGATYKEIALALNMSTCSAWKLINPERGADKSSRAPLRPKQTRRKRSPAIPQPTRT